MRYLIILLPFFITACGPDYIYEKTYPIKNTAWAYADSISFEVDIKDSSAIYNLYLDLLHSTEYPKQNMYVIIHTTFPNGKTLSEQVSLELANKQGVWFGACNSDDCELSIPIQTGAYFNISGQYRFTIEQFMRVNPLPGIKSIAFKIEDTGHRR